MNVPAMPSPMDPVPIRYVAGDNGLLRLCLYDAWGGRCYWCKEPARYSEIEIDHVIPKDLVGTELADALTDLGFPSDYHVHDPGNLAPIHGRCNSEKAAAWFGRAPRYLRTLELTARTRADVIRLVRAFQRSRNLAEASLSVLMADLNDPDERVALEALVDSVNRRLWPERFARRFWVELGWGEGTEVHILLDDSVSLKVVELWETLWGAYSFKSAIESMVAQSWEVAAEYVRSRIQSYEPVGIGPVDASPAVHSFRVWTFNRIRVERDGSEFLFCVEGTLEAHCSSSLAVMSADGDGLDSALIHRL